MINLLFDLNNLMYRSLFAVSGYGKQSFTFHQQSEVDQLMRKVATDISFIIRLINPSRVIFTKDDKSWRKNIQIDENDGYKAQRTKSISVNWDNIYTVINDFCDIAENSGIIISKISSAESDDLLSLWTHEIAKNRHQHCIIVSGDEDLRQLTNSYWHENKPSFITVFNPFMQGKNASRKLYVPNNFENWLNEAAAIDFMRPTIDINKEDFKKIISYDKTKMEFVDGRMIALRKMFCGDDGDNIPAIYSWLNEKDVEVRITNSKFEKIYEELQKTDINLIDYQTIIDRSDDVKLFLEKIVKHKISLNVKDRIIRQVKLVVLDKKFFPYNILEDFNKSKDEHINKPRVQFSNINMSELLKGTRYIQERKHESESSIFKQIDRIDRLNRNTLF